MKLRAERGFAILEPFFSPISKLLYLHIHHYPRIPRTAQSDASFFRRRSGITFKPVEQLLKGAFHQSSPTCKSCA